MSLPVSRYNVTWDIPSPGSSGSMPLGNGDIALNVWGEPSGDVLILIGKSDAWDQNCINLKLGRLRLSATPNPFAPGATFSQTLDLERARIEIQLGRSTWTLWVDANRPAVHIEVQSPEPIHVQSRLELWRTEALTVKTQTSDIFKNLTGPDPYPTIVGADRMLTDRALGRVMWCHHNEPREHDGYDINMRLQGLGDLLPTMPHPLRGRTFGAAMLGEGMYSVDDVTLRSATPKTHHHVLVCPFTLHPTTIPQWQNELAKAVSDVQSVRLDDARREHDRWWSDFWQRSWIHVTTSVDSESAAVMDISRAYALQRFMNACAGRGAFPIKHNGSLFSVGKDDDPDFRRWGGPGFWFMNQRLIYWPMLADGDFDLMLPWLRMYREMLPVQQHRTRTYFGHAGAHYPETVMFWGAEVSAHYGWIPFEKRERPEAECPYLTYYWQGGIELVLILWNHYVHTGDVRFAASTLLPIADAITEFFDLHYPRDSAGRIRFEPGQALETWHDATNPLPEIAGLRYVLPKLLELPDELLPASLRQRCTRMLGELPSIPLGQTDGQTLVLPAERFDRKKNSENPELYCVFPYRLFGVGKPDIEIARATFDARLHHSHDCWSQDDLQMALLGMTERAKQYVSARASAASHSDSRFPAFWNAFHDWVPDVDHGGVLQLALQFMLMQCEGRQIRLIPAWPREWDVDFRLHAPYQTIVEGAVRDGVITELCLTPQSRRADVIVGPN